MSTESITRISFKNNEVYIRSKSTNDTCPPAVHKAYSSLIKQGKEVVEKEILYNFWGRMFKGLSTIYGKCMNEFSTREFKKDKNYWAYYSKLSKDDLIEILYNEFLEYKKKVKKNASVKIKKN